MSDLLTVDADALTEQLPQVEAHLAQFGDELPVPLAAQLDDLKARLDS